MAEKIALAAAVPQQGAPQVNEVVVDPSNRTVTIGGLTFQLEPGTAPQPAIISFTAPQPGAVADSWDVYLGGHVKEAYYDYREASQLEPNWRDPRQELTRFTVRAP